MLQGLLSSPEPDDPLDTKVADHWKSDEKAAMERAREWTQRYANTEKQGKIEIQEGGKVQGISGIEGRGWVCIDQGRLDP